MTASIFKLFSAKVEEHRHPDEIQLLSRWGDALEAFIAQGEHAFLQQQVDMEFAISTECAIRFNILFRKHPAIYKIANSILSPHRNLHYYLEYAEQNQAIIHLGLAATSKSLSYEIYVMGWNAALQAQDFSDIPLSTSTVRMLGIDTSGHCSVYTTRLPPSPNFFTFTQSIFDTPSSETNEWNYYKHLKRDANNEWPLRKEGVEIFNVLITEKLKKEMQNLEMNYFTYLLPDSGTLPTLNFGYRSGCASFYIPFEEPRS